MYREIKPKDKLKNYIQSYWTITDVQRDSIFTVYPDGCFDIVVYIGDINEVIMTGIWDRAINVSVYSGINVVGVRFYPSSVDRFFNLTLAQLKNTKIKFKKEMLKIVKDLTIDMIFNSKCTDEIIFFYDFYFSYMVEGVNYYSVFDFIHSMNLNDRIETIAYNVGISSRHLTRQYKEKLGVTTKGYINIIRFIKAKEMLLSGKSFIEISNDCGYYDQSHFIKEFKKYTQFTPTEYLKHV